MALPFVHDTDRWQLAPLVERVGVAEEVKEILIAVVVAVHPVRAPVKLVDEPDDLLNSGLGWIGCGGTKTAEASERKEGSPMATDWR
jgi:hypothetical protein